MENLFTQIQSGIDLIIALISRDVLCSGQTGDPRSTCPPAHHELSFFQLTSLGKGE